MKEEKVVKVGMIVGVMLEIIEIGIIDVVIVKYYKGNMVWKKKLFRKDREYNVRNKKIILKKFKE